MEKLISSDIASAGIWRALIVKPIDQGRFSIYIPALHKAQMPFKDPENPKNGLIETNDKGEFTSGGLTMTLNDYPIANSCVWQARTVMDTGECVWVMFENGDVNYPVIMGQVGSNISITWDVNSLIAGASGSSSSNIAFLGDNVDYIFARLLEQKYPNAAICGILANIEAESGIRTNNLQNSYEASLNYTDESYTEAVNNGTYSKDSFINDSAGYGLIQWTSSGRKRLLYLYTVNKDLPIDDISAQVSLLIDELVSWGLADRLKSVSNDLEGAHQAAYIFCTEFEIPANKEEKAKERQNKATTYWNTYKDYTPTGGIGTITSGELNWPTESHTISSPWGYRIHPITRDKKFHNGIDISDSNANAGKTVPIYAAEAGEVKQYNPNPGGWGNFVVIRHATGLETLYAHLNTVAVTAGTTVTRGQVIGTMGQTGAATGPHLHFGVYPKGYNNSAGTTIDPMAYLTYDK